MNGDVLSPIDRQTFVDAPADGTVVHDDVVVVHRTETVTLMISNKLIAQTETHITEDDVVAGDDKRMIGYADAVARSCLSGNGDITVLDLQF